MTPSLFTPALIDWQQRLHAKLPEAGLLSGLIATAAERDALAETLAAQLQGPDPDESARRLMQVHPEVVAAYLVATGVHCYREGNYWEAVRAEFPLLTDKGLGHWRTGFLRFLQAKNLPAFSHVPGHRFVMPILAHGGIPKHCLESFFEALVWPAVADPAWAGIEADDLLTEAVRAAWFERLPQPVRRFLRFGGRASAEFLQLCLDMARSEQTTAAATPPHVQEAFAAFLGRTQSGRERQVAQPRYRRPSLHLDPSTGIVSLLLPAQQLLQTGAEGEVTWVLDLDGKRERLAVGLDWRPQGPTTLEARWWLHTPPSRLRASLWVGGRRLREWDWNFAGGPFPCFLFDGDTMLAVTREIVPEGAMWVVAPPRTRLEALDETGAPADLRVLGEISLAAGWSTLAARAVTSQGAHKWLLNHDHLTHAVLLESRAESSPQPDSPADEQAELRWALFGLLDRVARIELVASPVQIDLPSLQGAPHPSLLVCLPAGVSQASLSLWEGGCELQRLNSRRNSGAPGVNSRCIFELGALTDTLRSARSGSLQLRLHLPDSHAETLIATVTQAWNPQNLTAHWDAAGSTLQVQWAERVALTERYAWLWDQWRPWVPPVESEIPDDAKGTWTWRLEPTPAPGRYRLQLGLNSPWNPVVQTYPSTGEAGTCEVALGEVGEWDAYLVDLGDSPQARATRFLARAGLTDRAVEDMYYLEAQVEARDIEPLMHTLQVMERFSPADQARWRERLRDIACDYCAFDVARWLVDDWDRAIEQTQQRGIDALFDVGWWAAVGPNWEPLARPFALGDKRVVPQEPLSDTTRARLWSIWRPLGLGLECWPLDAAAVSRLQTHLPGVADLLRPWRTGARVQWRERWHVIRTLTPPEGLEEDSGEAQATLWQLAPPIGWRIELEGLGQAMPVDAEMRLAREVASEMTTAPTADYTDWLAWPPERWSGMRTMLGPAPLLSSQGATVADFEWLEACAADPNVAAAAADWAFEWQGQLAALLEELVQKNPEIQVIAAPALAAHGRVNKPKEVGYRLSVFPFVVAATALLARLRAWRIIDFHTRGLTRNGLDALLRQARHWAPARLERELLLADLLIGTWGAKPIPQEGFTP